MTEEQQPKAPEPVLIRTGNDGALATSKSSSPVNTVRRNGLPPSSLFLIGLLLPFFLGIIILMVVGQTHGHSVLHGPVYTPASASSVDLDDETYQTYDITMTSGFSDHYPPECHQNCWEFLVEVRTEQGEVEATVWGYEVGPSLNSFQPYEESGNEWYMMAQRHCESYTPEFDCDGKTFIKINSDGTVNIATNHGRPTFIEYAYAGVQHSISDEVRTIAPFMWPISLFAGIAWGYKTDRKPFAYGLMTGGVASLLLPTAVFLFVVITIGPTV